MVQAHIIFSGTVQGVGFRFTVQRFARSLHLSGWVKNLPDGTVEVLAEGAKERIETLCCHIEDYFKRYIRHKNIEWTEATDKFKDFQITY